MRIDDDREVDFTDEFPILPDQTRDDTDEGWSDRAPRTRVPVRDQRLLDERPPHWD